MEIKINLLVVVVIHNFLWPLSVFSSNPYFVFQANFALHLTENMLHVSKQYNNYTCN